MRWLVTLQVAVGLGALFGLAYKSVDGVVGPVTAGYADTAAQAEARAASADLSITWKSALEAQERVVRRLAATEALASAGTIFGRADRVRGLTLALEAAVAQAGGEGRAAVLGLNAAPIVDSEGAAMLGGSLAAQAAVGGVTAVHLEMLDGSPHVVAAAPLMMKGDLQGALVVATPLGTSRLRSWTRSLPAGTWVAVALDDKVVVNSAPKGNLAVLAAGQEVVDIAEEPHAIARRPAAGGAGVQVLGFAPIRSEGARAAVEQVELLVLVLGGLAFLLVAILVMLMPEGTAAPVAEQESEDSIPQAVVPQASPPASQPELSLNFPSRPPSADHPAATSPTGVGDATGMPPAREGGIDLQQAFAQKTVPSHPAPVGQAPAAPAAPPEAPVVPGGSQDLKAPVGGERSPFAKPSGVMPAVAPQAAPPPPTFPPPPTAPPAPAAPEFTPRQSAILTAPATPSMGSAAAASAPAAASPFDAIASAAMSASPPPASRGPAPAMSPSPDGSSDNLPAPKGGVPPEMVAAQRAKEQRAAHTRPPEPTMAGFSASPYDPELPAPKGPMPSSRPVNPSMAPSPATEPPRQPPGATQPPTPAIPLPGGAPPAQNPWRNPSVPAMNAPQPPKPAAVTQYPVNAPTSPPSTSVPAVSASGPYDESHYRTVYNEFVSSKAELGEAVENITYEGFRAKLRTSEQHLLERHQCRAVRFQVIVRDRTVSLRPQLLR